MNRYRSDLIKRGRIMVEQMGQMSQNGFFKVAKRELRGEEDVPKRSLGTRVECWL
jgi:hypothetical protein